MPSALKEFRHRIGHVYNLYITSKVSFLFLKAFYGQGSGDMYYRGQIIYMYYTGHL